MHLRALILVGVLLAWPARAQAPVGEPETVISQAQKDRLLSLKFVQSLLAPSNNLEGQFSRWKKPICPHVAGLAPAAAFFVERRIRDIARQAGAPLDPRDPCRTNIAIFVTAEPQAAIDAILAKDSLRLLTTAPDRDLTMRDPVQVWYAGNYRDDDGFLRLDAPRQVAYPWKDDFPPVFVPPPPSSVPLEGDAKANLTRLNTGLVPEMGDATVMVDFNTIKGMTLGSLGDYIALLTLAQTPVTGRCQPAPSIANLFLTTCDAGLHTTGLSQLDLAMLTALYQTPNQPENLQKTRLIGNMQRSLENSGR